MLTGDSKGRVEGYNERVNEELARRFGVADFNALSRDAWTDYVKQQPFPLRTDSPPKEWKANQINNGLPLRWEKGVAHVLAWEVIENERPWKFTQVLVLKKFDQPTEQGGHKWVLAPLYHHPEDVQWPWQVPRRIISFSPQ